MGAVACQYAGDASATSPAVPKCAWLSPRTARQSKDCLRVRVRRHASLRLRLARLAAAASPAQPIRSALSFVVAGLCGSLGSRSRIRRKTRHPSAVDGAERSVGIPPVASASIPSASAAPRRLTLAPPRAVAPPPAPHFRSTGEGRGFHSGASVPLAPAREPYERSAQHLAQALLVAIPRFHNSTISVPPCEKLPPHCTGGARLRRRCGGGKTARWEKKQFTMPQNGRRGNMV